MPTSDAEGKSEPTGGAAFSAKVQQLLLALLDDQLLYGRVRDVLTQLPAEVIEDFSEDPRFSITKLQQNASGKQTLWMALPSHDGKGSRCVVLKARLASCDLKFSRYIIAHELAHAYLRNGVWREHTDIEDAADALAAHWGFEKPDRLQVRSIFPS
ncbi:hypothetical protein Pla22_21250 [Rubripirellula amarantea]|uniref:SprT-like family protein n=1 Tax=Rubripirellula amarantea TaxID=2527999 RepID=A0A5C5WV43_9BACT|nr:hypothetical protein [Rubripirellula amarantea]TWT54478.1 hypothetical protein Pla22_21250 [Rubripirellula amarantea]